MVRLVSGLVDAARGGLAVLIRQLDGAFQCDDRGGSCANQLRAIGDRFARDEAGPPRFGSDGSIEFG